METTCSHVLVVDDDVDMCHQLSDYLGRNDAAADSREVSLNASALMFIRIGDPTDDRFSALGTSSKTEVSFALPRPTETDSARDAPVMPDTLLDSDLVAVLPRLRRYARVLTGDVNRADDLVQDTLARAWEKRRLWRVGSDLRAWLFTIMHNVHVNQFSLRQRQLLEISLDGDGGASGGWEIPVRATQSDRVELAEVLAQIAKLPVEQCEVLMLAAVEELRYEDIARVQGVPIGTVMSRLNRARGKLRRM